MTTARLLVRRVCSLRCRNLTSKYIVLYLLLASASSGPSVADTLTVTLSGTNVVISWTNLQATLESAPTVLGSWSTVDGASSPYPIQPSNSASFFRLNIPVINFDYRYVAPEFTTSIGDPSGCGCTSPENPNTLAAGGAAQDNASGNVLLHTGELTQHAVDLEIPGRGFNWRFERRYRSGMTYDGPLGQGWDFNYNRRLALQTNHDILCINGLGRVDRYVYSAGAYQSPGGFYTLLKTNLDGTFEERERHGNTNFYSAVNGLGIARLTRISDRNGNQMTFLYNSLGQLTNVTDTLARPIRYEYDGSGRLVRVVDFTVRTNQFAYDGNGNLVSVTSPSVVGTPNGNDFPNGKTTLYSYSSGFGDARFNHNLLTVTAPDEAAVSGPPRLVAQYDTNPVSPNADRLLSLFWGGTNSSGIGAGGTNHYIYASLGLAPSNDFTTAIFENTVSNRNGNVTEYRFNQLGNIVRSIQFTRGYRLGEPAGYTNHSTFNKDGEMLSRTFPELDVTLNTFDSANSDRLQQGNLLQSIHLSGPRGGDQPQLVTTFTYEPAFNFVRTNIDARSNVTVYSYDAAGNRTQAVQRIPSIVEVYEYNSFGQLTAHVWPDNGAGHHQRDEINYYATGPQTGYMSNAVIDAGGLNLTTTYSYDAVGNLVQKIDPRGNDTLFTVNALNQIVRQSSPQVSTISGLVRYTRDTFYDADDNIIRVDVQNRDDTGAVAANPAFTTTYSYDILNDLLYSVREVDVGTNITTASAYDANQNRVALYFGEATSGRQSSNSVATIYDERDLSLLETRAPASSIQSTTRFTYDSNGNLVTTEQGIEDLSGVRTTTSTWDGFNRRFSMSDPMGNVTSYHYDANGNLVSRSVSGELTDVPGGAGNTNLSLTSYTYDAMDRQTQKADSFFDLFLQVPIGDGVAATTTIYTPASRIFAVLNDNNHGKTNVYDGANRLSVTTDALGNTTTFAYDANGNLLTVTQFDKSDSGSPPQSFTTTRVYDSLDRVTSVTDNLTNLTQYRYDSRNNRALVTDARGVQTRYAYDGLNRLVSVSRDMNNNGIFTDAADILTFQTWDDSSRLVSQTDDNTNKTSYAYDALNRLVQITHADATTDSTTYDVHDNPTVVVDSNGSAVTSDYDLLDRAISRSIAPGPGVLSTVTSEMYRYDGMGRLVLASNNVSMVTRQYDSISDILRETQQALPSGPVANLFSSYDGLGNKLTCVYPGARTITNSYDALERLSTVRDAGGLIAVYRYIGAARAEQRDFRNGTRSLWQYDGITGILNLPGDFGVRQMARTTHTNFLMSGLVDDRAYTWDRMFDKSSATNSLRPELRSYSYDARDRLVASTWTSEGKNFSYSLDGVGNRTVVVSNGVPSTYNENSTMPEPADRQMNQYTAFGADARQYDRNGNLTSAAVGSRLFGYDYRNQLVSFADNTLFQTGAYRYDCLGRRIERANNAGTVRYYYDGSRVVEEQTNNLTAATYVWGRPGDLLTMARAGTNYFYHCDDLGSVRAVTDGSGNRVETYAYSDFGLPSFFDGSGVPRANSAINNPWLFCSRLFDTESALTFWGDRYLDHAAGRLISRISDAIWTSGSPLGNPFTFNDDNPLGPPPLGGQSLCAFADNNSDSPKALDGDPQFPGLLLDSADSTSGHTTTRERTVCTTTQPSGCPHLCDQPGSRNCTITGMRMINSNYSWQNASRDDYLDLAAAALSKLIEKGVGKLGAGGYGQVLGQALTQSLSIAKGLQSKTFTTQNLWINVKWQTCEEENCHYGFCWLRTVRRRNWHDKEQAFKLNEWDPMHGDAAEFGAAAAAAIDAQIKELCP